MQNPQAKSELVCFLPEHIPSLWATVSPLIDKALPRSRYTLSDIFNGLVTSKMQLWTAYSFTGGRIEAALVTALQDGYCLLLACGGENMAEWKQWLNHKERMQ